MHHFLEKRELVSFCVCDTESIPRKEDYTTTKTTSKRNKDTKNAHVLPDGSIHFLEMKRGWSTGIQSFTLKTTQEFKKGLPHGKYNVFSTWQKGKEKLYLEGTFRKGNPHGVFFFYDPDGVIEHTYTFINGRVLEISWSNGDSLISRNRKNGATHYLQKGGTMSLPLNVFRCAFSELESEQRKDTFLLSGMFSQKFKTYECRNQLIFPSFACTQENKFSNRREGNFLPNKICLSRMFFWAECPFVDTEDEVFPSAQEGGPLSQDQIGNPLEVIFI
uniref:MORN repeat-containing protein n=1 Tax=Marseillevirus sp. TaxID=2809551 RepID=A0AA96EMX3_9VIRU|nr:hypothetical protein MarFTMF_457 [Marseillevirus sp.]